MITQWYCDAACHVSHLLCYGLVARCIASFVTIHSAMRYASLKKNKRDDNKHVFFNLNALSKVYSIAPIDKPTSNVITNAGNSLFSRI